MKIAASRVKWKLYVPANNHWFRLLDDLLAETNILNPFDEPDPTWPQRARKFHD